MRPVWWPEGLPIRDGLPRLLLDLCPCVIIAGSPALPNRLMRCRHTAAQMPCDAASKRRPVMARRKPSEQEPWWPAALVRFAELAAGGYSKSKACKILSREFPVSDSTFSNTCDRGSVSAYPARDKARAVAWTIGKTTYDGAVCAVHGTNSRFSNDGICVQCSTDALARREARIQAWRAIAEGQPKNLAQSPPV